MLVYKLLQTVPVLMSWVLENICYEWCVWIVYMIYSVYVCLDISICSEGLHICSAVSRFHLFAFPFHVIVNVCTCVRVWDGWKSGGVKCLHVFFVLQCKAMTYLASVAFVALSLVCKYQVSGICSLLFMVYMGCCCFFFNLLTILLE